MGFRGTPSDLTFAARQPAKPLLRQALADLAMDCADCRTADPVIVCPVRPLRPIRQPAGQLHSLSLRRAGGPTVSGQFRHTNVKMLGHGLVDLDDRKHTP
jgi:hypothetical protein